MDSQRTKAKGYISIHNQEKGEERLGKPAAESWGFTKRSYMLQSLPVHHFSLLMKNEKKLIPPSATK